MKHLSLALFLTTMLAGPLAYAQDAAVPADPAMLEAPAPAATPTDAASVPQETAPADTAAATPATTQIQPVPGIPGPAFNKDDYGSILFTHWEYIAIQDNILARDSNGAVRPVTPEELTEALDESMPPEERPKPPPEQRELRLAGIVYEGPGDWAFWLNETRYTPDALPKEALETKVYENYIEIKWYDEWSNKIYPIRLRPHQRFNIDTRIFLPGI